MRNDWCRRWDLKGLRRVAFALARLRFYHGNRACQAKSCHHRREDLGRAPFRPTPSLPGFFHPRRRPPTNAWGRRRGCWSSAERFLVFCFLFPLSAPVLSARAFTSGFRPRRVCVCGWRGQDGGGAFTLLLLSCKRDDARVLTALCRRVLGQRGGIFGGDFGGGGKLGRNARFDAVDFEDAGVQFFAGQLPLGFLRRCLQQSLLGAGLAQFLHGEPLAEAEIFALQPLACDDACSDDVAANDSL